MLLLHHDAILKLCLSLVFGIIIGLEREIKKKPLGLKTTIVIAVSSCLLTVVSIEAAFVYSEAYQMPMDPLRLAAQIVSGVGFLGAGAILRRNNDVISGLTTAAMIWGAAGIGITIGAGFYQEAFIAMFFMIISVEVIAPLLKKWGPKILRQSELKARLTVPGDTSMQEIFKAVKEKNIKIGRTKVKEVPEKSVIVTEMILIVHNNRGISDIYSEMKSIPGIQSIEIETL